MSGVNMKEIEKGLASFEQGFNIASYTLGLISKIPGQYRMMYGSLETVTGIALFALEGVKACFTTDAQERSEGFKKAFNKLVYSGHGVLNFARGYGEACVPLFPILGLAWDLSGFRLKYSVENEKAGRLLTMDMITQKVTWVRQGIERAFAALG